MTTDGSTLSWPVERRRVLQLVAASVVGMSSGLVEPGRSVPDYYVDFDQYRGTAAGGGTVYGTAGPVSSLTRRWRKSYGVDPSPPVLHDGTLYFTSDAQLFAVNPDDGAVEWQRKYDKQGGDFTMPAVTDGTAVVVTGRALGVPRDGTPQAVGIDTADGSVRWRTDVPSLHGVPRITDGSVYVIAGVGDGNYSVRSLALDDGSERWKYGLDIPHSLSAGNDGNRSVAVANGTVYVGEFDDSTNTLVAIDADTGSKTWKRSYGTSYDRLQGRYEPAVAGDTGCIGALLQYKDPFARPEVYKYGYVGFDADSGESLWSKQTNGRAGHPPAVAGSKTYLPSKRSLVAVDKRSGDQVWKTSLGTKIGSPTVVSGVAFVRGDDGTLFAVDAETGDVVWRRSVGGYGHNAGPSVTNGRVYVSARDGPVTAIEGEPLLVTLPSTTGLSGLARSFTGVVENKGSEPLSNVDTTVSPAGSSGDVTVTNVTGVPTRLSGGERRQFEIGVDVTPSAQGNYGIEVDATSDRTKAVTTIGNVAVEETIDVTATPLNDTSVSAGREETIKFSVTANDHEAVSDVELLVKFSELPDGWTVAYDGDPNVGTPDGGNWEATGTTGEVRWTIDELSAGETRTPSIPVDVPESISEGSYEFPVEASVVADGSRQLVNVERPTISVVRHVLFPRIDTPSRELSGGATAEVTVSLDTRLDPIETPEIYLYAPDKFTVKDGSASGSGTATVADDYVRFNWSGTFQPDGAEVVSGTMTVQAPGPDDKKPGGTYEFRASAYATNARTGAFLEQRTTGSVEVSGLAGRISRKRDTAKRIDKLTFADIDEVETVETITSNILAATRLEDRDGDGDAERRISRDRGEKAVERLLLGEGLAERVLEITGPAPPQASTAPEYNFGKKTAKNFLNAGIGLATSILSLGTLAKAVTKIPLVGPVLAEFVNTAKWAVKSLVDDWFRLPGSNRATDFLVDKAGSVVDSFTTSKVTSAVKDQYRNTVGGVTGSLSKQMRTNLVEEGARGTDPEDRGIVEGLGDLNEAMQLEDVESGLEGDQAAATAAYQNGLDYVQSKSKALDSVIADFSDGLLGDIWEFLGAVAETLYLEDLVMGTVYDAVTAFKEGLDVITTVVGTVNIITFILSAKGLEEFTRAFAVAELGIRTGVETDPG